jgi:hypothetical protein
VICSILLILIYLKRFKLTDATEITAFKENFSALFDEFKGNAISSELFYLIFIIRRLLFCVTVFIITDPILQLSICTTFCLIVRCIQNLTYIAYTFPMKDKTLTLATIINEAATICYYVILISPNVAYIQPSVYKASLYCTYLILMNFAINILIGVLSSIIKIIFFIKAHLHIRSSRIQVLPTAESPVPTNEILFKKSTLDKL